MLARWLIHVNYFCVQFKAEGTYNFKDCVETRTSFPGESFVKTFAGQSSVTRNLCHTLGPRDISQGFRNKSSIAISLLKASFKVGSHFFFGSKMFSNIVLSSDGLSHDMLQFQSCL